jgi:GH15 family glucan-1,4-alpha-glucosidase
VSGVSTPLEDYAVIGDTQTVALVSRAGSIDWLCFPRFDSPACFAALLGTPDHGRWLLAPESVVRTTRRYRGDTLVLETTHETESGVARVVDLMPVRGRAPDVVRVIEGVAGTVRLRCELAPRFDYGAQRPWVRSLDGAYQLVAGPDALVLRTPAELHRDRDAVVGDVTVGAGEQVPFVLTWHESHSDLPDPIDGRREIELTESWWQEWAARCMYEGPYRDAVVRSLVTLKALTYQPTGGIVAAATTSLPELVGGPRNWDYRYCWLRDATFTLLALMRAGFDSEAEAWRSWLLRAVAGDPAQTQIMYGVAGERRLDEWEVGWLPGYEGSTPVRVGNAAARQLQLDVYGQVLDCLYQARTDVGPGEPASWEVQRRLLDFLTTTWREPDEGIWEVRGPRRHFVHSKVMAWVAFDRGVRGVREHGRSGPVEDWERIRDEIRAEVCEHGYDEALGSFTQYYGSGTLDASLLLLPLVGFLPADDPRVRGTVEAVERSLCVDGLVLRYRTEEGVDGLPPGEGAFLACSFWLADCLILLGETERARALFQRLVSLANDVGLLAEQYDAVAGRQLGNVPQAFSHVGLVTTAFNLGGLRG